MTCLFLWLALLAAVIDWVALIKKWQPLDYVAKPGVMVLLLAWLWQVSGLRGPLIWFAAGLVFSLAGDVFLMLPREQFIAGLGSFLLAHLAYMAGFNTTLPAFNLASLSLLALVALTVTQVYRRIANGLEASGEQKLKLPVLAYTSVIGLMTFSALLTLIRPAWEALPAFVVSAGALLFFISDLSLAWNKFVAPLPLGRLRVRITYHLGQALITLGAMIHFVLG
jgi:uncharacterized membrane protein YhhN